MSVAFRHYDSISYSENCKGVNKLNKKKEQATKILEITNKTCYIKNLSKKQSNKFMYKMFVFFISGIFSSIIQNIFDHYFDRLMAKSGFEKCPVHIEVDIE